MKNNSNIIIDCSSIIYSSFYAYGALSTEGKKTGILFGFLTKILKIAKELDSNRLYFCFDHEDEEREKLYPEYKHKRKQKKKEFTQQERYEYHTMVEQSIELHNYVLPKIGFRNIFQQPGYESDDLMAVLVNTFKNSDRKTLMVTSDNDMYQCLEHCDIVNPSTMAKFTMKMFMDKYKVYPSQWPICKAHGGCESDSVLGIQGMSDPKNESSKALKYILKELTKGKIVERIKSEEGQKIIKRNIQLVTLPYPGTKQLILRRNKITKQNLLDIFNKYKFKSFLEFDRFKEWERCFLK